jgi:hypothetical protein
MMRSVFLAVVGMCVVLLAASQTADAVGLGAYARYGTASIESEDDLNGIMDLDQDNFSIGLVLDTAVARRSVFNYRLELGYTTMSADAETTNYEFDFAGGEMNHTFGFAIVKARSTRIWLGPKFRLAGGSGEIVNSDGIFGGLTGTADATYVSLGAGPVLGGNHHFGSVMSVCWTLDYVYRYGLVMPSDNDGNRKTSPDDLEISGGGVSGSLAMVFHLGGETQ